MSKFDAYTIINYTCKYASFQTLPKVKSVECDEVKFSQNWRSMTFTDPFDCHYLPPHSDLLLWRSRLRDLDSDIHPYISSNHGNFNLDTVEQAIRLHDAKSVRDCYVQELNWFANRAKLPRT